MENHHISDRMKFKVLCDCGYETMYEFHTIEFARSVARNHALLGNFHEIKIVGRQYDGKRFLYKRIPLV